METETMTERGKWKDLQQNRNREQDLNRMVESWNLWWKGKELE